MIVNNVFAKGQGIQNIQQQMLGQAMGSIGGQPMVQYQQQTQQVYQQSLGLQQVGYRELLFLHIQSQINCAWMNTNTWEYFA